MDSVTTNSSPSQTSFDPRLVLRKIEQEIATRSSEKQLLRYQPYPKQLVFHEAGLTFRERLLMAANQVGKTLAAGNETAMHLTGRYPPWWPGRRFERATNFWASGKSGTDTRDNPQRILVGRPGAWGTGSIPKDAIVSTSAGRGVADAIDTIRVRHSDGTISTCTFKTYDQGRERWQGETLDGVWFDEEPPEDIYIEGLTRTNATGGIAYITFTPLLGISNVVRRFYIDHAPGTHITQMTIDDAGHYSPEQKAKIIASYPEFERKARTQGIPQLGSGRVFPVDEGQIACASIEIPRHWPRINGIDFGYDHPSAGVQLVWDRDSDVLYVTCAYRQRQQTPAMFAPAVRPWGEYPWAWPHDGLQHDKGSGLQLAAQYRKEGLRMLAIHSQYEDGTWGVEAGIMEMLDRMQTGRFKVFAHLREWFEESSLYHSKDGQIAKEAEDLMSATRYAVMMKRLAAIKAAPRQPYVPTHAPQPQGWMG